MEQLRKQLKEMTTFKCRAECLGDCYSFIKKAKLNINWKIELTPLNITMTFESSKTNKDLVLIANSIVDCHILMGTIQPIEFYDGERVWDVYDGKAHIDNSFLSPYSALINLIRKKQQKKTKKKKRKKTKRNRKRNKNI